MTISRTVQGLMLTANKKTHKPSKQTLQCPDD